MRHVVPISLVLAGTAVAQQPGLLPPSITGQTPPSTVVPVAAASPAPKPMARYQNLAAFPPETRQAVEGAKAAADWLARLQQSHGRFFPGLNPAIRMPTDGDTEYRQALAAWAVCQAARFTGDDKLAACGGQAILSLLANCPDDPADPATKQLTCAPGCNKVGFAAALALACMESPTADPRLAAEADKLCATLRKRVQPTGAIACDEPDGPSAYPGLAMQALVMNMGTDAAKREVVTRMLAHYRAKFRAAPHAVVAGTMVPACVDLFTRTQDRDAAGAALEMVDWLVASQIGSDGRHASWAGGFRTAGDEPTADSCHAVRALAAGCQLARQLPDVTRYGKYRPATVAAVGFARGLQYTPENTDHFEGKFRVHYLLGGVRAAAADGCVRTDATALACLAHLRFLASGADGRE